MHKSIAAVDLKPTVFAGMLHDSRRRKPLAGWCRSMSDAAGSWEAAKRESQGAVRTASICAILQRGGDSWKRISYLEMEHLVILFSFCDQCITKIASLNWGYTL